MTDGIDDGNEGKAAPIRDANEDWLGNIDIPRYQIKWRCIARIPIIIALIYILVQFCAYIWPSRELIPPNIYCTYIALGVLLAFLILDRIWRHESLTHYYRCEEPDSVRNTITQAQDEVAAESRHEVDGHNSRLSGDADVNALEQQVNRLLILGPEAWTGYEVLPLHQTFIPFWTIEEVIEASREYLGDLRNYAQDTKYRYEWEQVTERKRRIDEIIEKLESNSIGDGATKRSDLERRLRSMLSALIEHVTGYRDTWARGTAMIRTLTVCQCIAVGVLLFFGLMPIIHPDENAVFTILNWAALGSVGAVAASLRLLRQEEAIEVGDTEGKQETRKAILGAVLGLLAGAIGWALIAGGLVDGNLFPSVDGVTIDELGSEVAKAVFWALAAGYSFEAIFDRLRSASSNVL